eukprot:scaffold104685_cov33-Tisochrysis_lutea.AAC.2
MSASPAAVLINHVLDLLVVLTPQVAPQQPMRVISSCSVGSVNASDRRPCLDQTHMVVVAVAAAVNVTPRGVSG